MTITTAAAEMIRDALTGTSVPHPVVCLLQVSDVPAEIDEAIKRGATQTEIRELASKVLGNEPKYLYPGIYPRSRFLWIFTTMIDGFRFASPFMHPPSARCAMKYGLLDVAKRGL